MPTATTKATKTATTAKPRARAVAERRAPRTGNVTEPVLGDHPDSLGIIHRAMVGAAEKAVDENDRLGISTPGAKDGGIVYRAPPGKRRGRTRDTG